MSNGFSGQVAWITGGGSGIGRSLALELGRQGAAVVVSGRRRQKLDEVVEALAGVGAEGLAVTCDVTSEEDVARAVEEVVAWKGRLDVAVANAGFAVAGPIRTLTADDWRRQLDTNVIGLTTTVRLALPHLEKTRGRIALVGSVSAQLASPGFGAYSASKYAVRAIGQTLSMELHGTGVSCTTIHPGFVESEIAQVDNQGVHHPGKRDHRPQAVMWSGERAGRVMARAIRRRSRELTFTGHGKLGAFVGRHLPGVAHAVFTRGGGRRRSRTMSRASAGRGGLSAGERPAALASSVHAVRKPREPARFPHGALSAVADSVIFQRGVGSV